MGYLVGTNIGAIYAQLRRYELYLLIAVAVLILALITRRLLHHRRDPLQHDHHDQHDRDN